MENVATTNENEVVNVNVREERKKGNVVASWTGGTSSFGFELHNKRDTDLGLIRALTTYHESTVRCSLSLLDATSTSYTRSESTEWSG